MFVLFFFHATFGNKFWWSISYSSYKFNGKNEKKRLSNYEQSTKNITDNSASGNKKENNKDDDLILLRNIERNLSFNDDDFFGMKDDVKDDLKEDSDLKEDDDKDDIFFKEYLETNVGFLDTLYDDLEEACVDIAELEYKSNIQL